MYLLSYLFMYLPSHRSTLVPYTTLFRSTKSKTFIGIDVSKQQLEVAAYESDYQFRCANKANAFGELIAELRSEEHTSELQSHHDLVCRLLHEKKNNA